jgi:hypothetical protein
VGAVVVAEGFAAGDARGGVVGGKAERISRSRDSSGGAPQLRPVPSHVHQGGEGAEHRLRPVSIDVEQNDPSQWLAAVAGFGWRWFIGSAPVVLPIGLAVFALLRGGRASTRDRPGLVPFAPLALGA